MKATRKVVIVAGAATLTGAFWYLTHRGVAASPQPPIARPAATAAPRSPAPATIAAHVSPAARNADAAGTLVDICGMGSVRAAQEDPDGTAILAARSATDQGRWLAAMRISGDPRARAAAAMLTDGDQSEALAGLALQGDDPALYDIALNACSKSNAPSAACAQVSPQAWTQLDADNAAAWLQAAWRSRHAGDAAGEHAAMARAAAAHRIEDYNFSLLAYSQANIPADVGVAEWNYLAAEAVGIETATGASGYLEASKYCSTEAVNDPGVAQQCRAIAELLYAQGNNLIDLTFAKSIGSRAGWSQDRVALAARYVDALMAGAERLEPLGASRWSCNSARATHEYLLEVSRRGGEVGALRDRLEQSGEGTRELARQHRQYIEDLMGRAAASDTANEAPNADPQR